MVLDIGSDLFKKKVRDFDVSDFLISRSIVSLKINLYPFQRLHSSRLIQT